MFTPAPRVQVPSAVASGEVFPVKTLISHQMETGLRHDERGNATPRNITDKITCRHNGVVVYSVNLHETMAANPSIRVHLRATESGRLDCVWKEDGGGV